MSYILDALRKLERERVAGAPGITTVHATPRRPRFRLEHVASSAVAVAALAGVVWGGVVWRLRPSPPAAPVGGMRAEPERIGPVGRLPDARALPAPTAAVERAPRPAPPHAPAPPVSARETTRAAAPPPAPSAANARDERATAPPAAAAPRSAAASTSTTTPAFLPPMKLEVLVYSDVPSERIVFINGRKYVEGQTVDGGAVVERIDPDGVTLLWEGRRAVLRQ